jgi:hypothetical protein
MTTVAVGFALLQPGQHHGVEVPEGTAGVWMAVTEENGVPVLKQVTVRLDSVVDEVLDEGTQKTGLNVVTEGLSSAPLVLIRGPGLTEGQIKVPDQRPRPLFPGDRQWFVLGDQQLEVFGVGSTNSAGDIETFGLYAPPTVILERGPMELEHGSVVPSVLFVGDLDRDGRLDLIVDTATHYNVSHVTLFLSGVEPGKLVAVAVAHTSGC